MLAAATDDEEGDPALEEGRDLEADGEREEARAVRLVVCCC